MNGSKTHTSSPKSRGSFPPHINRVVKRVGFLPLKALDGYSPHNWHLKRIGATRKQTLSV